MRVKLLKPAFHAPFLLANLPGETVDVPNELAAQLIQSGHAEQDSGTASKPETATDPRPESRETATTKR